MAIINNSKLSIYDTNGKVVGIADSEIAAILDESMITDSSIGATGYGLGYLCKSVKINPKSKIKPISHPKLERLDDDDRRGAPNDISKGIIYGLQVASNESNLEKLHEANWEYVGRPTGNVDESPYRRLDFDGYDHNAQVTLSGNDIPTQVNYTANIPFTVQIEWNLSNNTAGVDVGECLTGMRGSQNYADIYLYVLIGDYMIALINNDVPISLDGDNNGPLYNINAGIYSTRFSCPKLPSALQSPGTRKVSVVAGLYNSALLSSWVNVSGTATVTGLFITIPNMAGIEVSFSEGSFDDKSGTFTNGTISLGLLGNTVMVSWKMAKAPTETTNYRVNIVFGGRPGSAKTFTLQPPASFGPPIMQWDTNELGLVPSAGKTYTVEASLYALNASGTASLKATASGTITWGSSGDIIGIT